MEIYGIIKNLDYGISIKFLTADFDTDTRQWIWRMFTIVQSQYQEFGFV